MNTFLHLLLACAGLLSLTGPARAVVYDFTVTGDYMAHFQIDSNPVVNVLDPDAFSVEGVAGTYAGVIGMRDVTFYTPILSGGMAISTPDPFVSEMSVFGEQVFIGSIDEPTFVPGTYDFTGYVGLDEGKSVRLVISAVPEPSTWLTLMAGIGMLGATRRARSSAV